MHSLTATNWCGQISAQRRGSDRIRSTG